MLSLIEYKSNGTGKSFLGFVLGQNSNKLFILKSDLLSDINISILKESSKKIKELSFEDKFLFLKENIKGYEKALRTINNGNFKIIKEF